MKRCLVLVGMLVLLAAAAVASAVAADVKRPIGPLAWAGQPEPVAKPAAQPVPPRAVVTPRSTAAARVPPTPAALHPTRAVAPVLTPQYGSTSSASASGGSTTQSSRRYAWPYGYGLPYGYGYHPLAYNPYGYGGYGYSPYGYSPYGAASYPLYLMSYGPWGPYYSLGSPWGGYGGYSPYYYSPYSAGYGPYGYGYGGYSYPGAIFAPAGLLFGPGVGIGVMAFAPGIGAGGW
ncbi:MAG: hypothetical protein ABSF26_27780 [Thermoguttaceae bacterium]|jgi:hypothetical protein